MSLVINVIIVHSNSNVVSFNMMDVHCGDLVSNETKRNVVDEYLMT